MCTSSALSAHGVSRSALLYLPDIACCADEEIAEALANGEEVIPLNMEPTLVELLDIGVQRLKERPTWKVGRVLVMLLTAMHLYPS